MPVGRLRTSNHPNHRARIWCTLRASANSAPTIRRIFVRARAKALSLLALCSPLLWCSGIRRFRRLERLFGR